MKDYKLKPRFEHDKTKYAHFWWWKVWQGRHLKLEVSVVWIKERF